MKANNINAVRRSRPVTLALLVAAGAWYIYLWATSAQPQRPAYWRAENGRLVPAKTPAASRARKLIKPGPADLLARSQQLDLSERQIHGLQAIETGWRQRREQLEARIRRATAFVSSEKSRPLAQLGTDLDAYSALSREYGDARRAAWEAALNVLSSKQRVAALAAMRGGQK